MKKRDILGLIRLDVERKKKPKKRLDDFLLGDEDQHEEIMKTKREPEEKVIRKKSIMDEPIGVSKVDEAASKPTIKPLEWGSLAKMSMREQNITLKREYISLLEKLEEVSSMVMKEKGGNNEKNIEIEKSKRESKILRDFLRSIVDFIPDGYDLKMQMDTTAWEVNDIKDEVFAKFKSLITKIRFTDKIIEEETKKTNAQKKSLEIEITRARERIKELEQMLRSGIATAGDDVENDSSDLQERPAPTVQKHMERESQIPVYEEPEEEEVFGNDSGDVPEYVYMDIDRYLENLPADATFLLDVIGRTGVSRNSELKREVEKSPEGQSFFQGEKIKTHLNPVVKLLKDRQFLDTQEVNLGARGYKFDVYELSDIGKAVYYRHAKKHPVEPEMKKMLADHKSLEHGYLIREVADEFREKGYTVYEDRETCTYKLDNNKRKVFDLIIEKDGQKQHIEVERGTHNDDDFFKAMDKIYQITTDFYFVAPNEKILYQVTKGKVFKWITDRLGGFENAKGKMKMHFSTIEKIKKSNEPWEIFAL